MIGRRWMQSSRRSCSPSFCITGGNFRTYTATRLCVSVSWLWMVHPASPKCKAGDGSRLDAKPRSLASSGARSPGAPRVPHFSPFFCLRSPPFVLLIEFFSLASRRRPRVARYVQKSSIGYDVAERRARHEEKSPAVNYRVPNLKYIPLYRLIQPSDVTFFSFAG